MESMIARLWNGNLSPAKTCGNENAEIQELRQLIARSGEKLEQALDGAQQKLLERFVCNMEEYLCLLTEQAFCDGFCIGSRLSAESFGAEV